MNTQHIDRLEYRSHAWLDTLAVGMSILCAIHCMITPIIISVLPVIASSLFAHKHFHLWMLFFVLPTTSFSVFLGCRKHKDRSVLLFAALGLLTLTSVALYESFFHSAQGLANHAHCAACASQGKRSFWNATTLTNILGAFFLCCAHIRNFVLCRKADCCHQECG